MSVLLNQIRGLLLKDFYLLNTQKTSTACVLLTPLLTLLIFYQIHALVTSHNLVLMQRIDSMGILPYFIYPLNLMNSQNAKMFSRGFYKIEGEQVIHRVGVKDKGMMDRAKDMFSALPYGYYHYWHHSRQPHFSYSNFTNISSANILLSDNLLQTTHIPKQQLYHSPLLPDTSILLNRIDNKYGIDAHVQVNNLIMRTYHRPNGFTFSYVNAPKDGDGGRMIPLLTGTEAYLSMVNLFSNTHIQSLSSTQGMPPSIVGICSPTVDSNIILSFIDSAYGVIGTMLLPQVMSLGLPLMLSILVQENLSSIPTLLSLHSVPPIVYSLISPVSHALLMILSGLIFVSAGIQWVPIKLFRETSPSILYSLFTVFSISQVMMAVPLSRLIPSVHMSTIIGQALAFLLPAMTSGISIFLYPYPSRLPCVFYMCPQALFSRGLYLLFHQCALSSCLSTLTHANWPEELSTVFNGLYMHILICALVIAALHSRPLSLFTVQKGVTGVPKEGIFLSGENISVIYPGRTVPALSSLNINLLGGEIYGLLGPNGAGKSTLLKVLTHQLTPSTGRVSLPLYPGAITLCPQMDILWQGLSPWEHMHVFALIHSVPVGDIQKLLASLDLERKMYSPAGVLSGGMMRRLSLGISVIARPRILLLDEPTNGLDPVHRHQFWKIVKGLAKDRAILLTTHLMEEADALCHRVGIITAGSIRCEGAPRQLKSLYSPGTHLHMHFTKPVNSEPVSSFLSKLTSTVPLTAHPTRSPSSLIYTIPNGHNLGGVIGLIRGEDMLIDTFTLSTPTMEDVYMAIIEKYPLSTCNQDKDCEIGGEDCDMEVELLSINTSE